VDTRLRRFINVDGNRFSRRPLAREGSDRGGGLRMFGGELIFGRVGLCLLQLKSFSAPPSQAKLPRKSLTLNGLVFEEQISFALSGAGGAMRGRLGWSALPGRPRVALRLAA
jgi:hypothetical protein